MSHVNVGRGEDITVQELAELVCRIVGFEGRILNDTSMPDGTPRKLMGVSRLFSSGWQPKYELEEGLTRTYAWFLENVNSPELRV